MIIEEATKGYYVKLKFREQTQVTDFFDFLLNNDIYILRTSSGRYDKKYYFVHGFVDEMEFERIKKFKK